MRHSFVFLRLVAILFLLPFLSGCVYLRLASCASQLEKLDRYFAFEEKEEGFFGRFKRPVLYIQDLKLILGSEPKKTPEPLMYAYTFSKSKGNDIEPWEISFMADRKKRILSFLLPPKLLDILGADFIKAGMKAVGKGKIDIREKRLHFSMTEKLKLEQVLRLLGTPLKREDSQLHYVFTSGDSRLVISIVHEKDEVQMIRIQSGAFSAFCRFIGQ